MAVKQIAESQSNQAAILFPVDPEMGGKMVEGVDRIEPSPVGLENMLRIVDEYFGGQIRRYIVGQDSTSQPVRTGLGSKIAEVHERSFNRIIKYDATNLQETLTRQLVHVVQKWSYPECPFKCKFVIDVDRPDPESYLKAVKLFTDMGGTVSEDEVRSTIGYEKPLPSDTILGGPKPVMLPQNNGDHTKEQRVKFAYGSEPPGVGWTALGACEWMQKI